MSDKTILAHIGELIEEENRLKNAPAAPADAHARIRHLEEQLDQCWDLLRQRRARRQYGEDPSDAHARDESTVEGYQQ
jgi:hypothetical protein